jgi:hypothetical protein
MTNAATYLSQPVNYGGATVTRGEMITDLERIAAESGHPNPQMLVDRYLQGMAR